MRKTMILNKFKIKQDQKDLPNFPLYRALNFYTVMWSLWMVKAKIQLNLNLILNQCCLARPG